MAAIKVYLDEDVHTFMAHALRLRGWDALTTEEAGRLAASDLDHITFAAAHGYTIVTYNIRDFPRLHAEIVTGGGSHTGIIVATRQDPRGTFAPCSTFCIHFRRRP